MDSATQTLQHRISVKLWPPGQSTRLMLVERMTKNFITPSFISRKYGLLSKEEAEEDAKKIEEVAFAAANQHYEKQPDGDGSSAVQVYAKESSRLMLEVLKRGPRIQEDEEVATTADKGAATLANMFDISGGRRAFISGEEAEEVLKPLKVPGNLYTRICFSNRSFGLEAAHVTEPILLSIKDQLTEVDLSDFVAGRSESEALEVMNIFSSALEGCNLRVGLEGGVALAKALGSCKHLRKLDLRDNMFGVEAGIALSRSLFAFADLTEAYLSYLNLEDEGAEALANALKECAPSLEVLDMAGNDITAKGIDEVKDIFKGLPNVLGNLDENDPDGELDEDAKEEDEDTDNEDELESKLKGLEIKHEE
ncbi:hypothetical protein D5086_004489 [Populus alba]|uniref:Uncharacterized protein n=1 Tax=Populus alba TaxID=43335 RepID=A0ACC4CQN4_POPAL